MGRRAENIIAEILAANDPVAIALGRVQGVTLGDKFGRNPSIDTSSDPEDVWNGGGIYTGQPETGNPETIEVFSSSADDDIDGGTGAHTVRLLGLDADWQPQQVDIDLEGMTSVFTTETWRRQPRARVIAAGSGRVNAGTITSRMSTTTANVFMVLPIGTNRTAIAADTIPAGKTGVILAYYPGASRGGGAGGYAGVQLLTREPGLLFESRDFSDPSTGANPVKVELADVILPEMSDWRVRAAEVSANGTAVTARVREMFLDNAFFGL